MHDPREGLTSDGMITTGVGRAHVPVAFEPLIAEVVAEFQSVASADAELHLYGSVATGYAQVGRSDVDLLVIDGPEGWDADASRRLSTTYAELCRGVEIGAGRASDFTERDDESYGNQVFLRHYCVWLTGANRLRRAAPFAGDERAARGFNGDIGRHLARWRSGSGGVRSIGRKSLFAVAGLVGVRDSTWTTDRVRAARRWAELEPRRAADIEQLLAWSVAPVGAVDDAAREFLAPRGLLSQLVEQFADEVGLWSD